MAIISRLLNLVLNTSALVFQNPPIEGDSEVRVAISSPATDTFARTSHSPPLRLTDTDFRTLIGNLNSNDALVRERAFGVVGEQFPDLITDLDSSNFQTRERSRTRFEELLRNCPIENLETLVRRLQGTRRNAPNLEFARRIDSLLSRDSFAFLSTPNYNVDRKIRYTNALFNTGIFNDADIQALLDNNVSRDSAVRFFSQHANPDVRALVARRGGAHGLLSIDSNGNVRHVVALYTANQLALHNLLQDNEEYVKRAALGNILYRLRGLDHPSNFLPETLNLIAREGNVNDLLSTLEDTNSEDEARQNAALRLGLIVGHSNRLSEERASGIIAALANYASNESSIENIGRVALELVGGRRATFSFMSIIENNEARYNARIGAMRSLVNTAPESQVVPFLTLVESNIRNPENIRRNATFFLNRITRMPTSTYINDLMTRLVDSNSDERSRSIAAIELGHTLRDSRLSEERMDVIIGQLINHANNLNSTSAIMALGEIGRRAIPALMSIAENNQAHGNVRLSAISRLGFMAIGNNAPQSQIIPALIVIENNLRLPQDVRRAATDELNYLQNR